MTIIGAIARSQESPEKVREIALAAEDAGLDELWLWEDSFFAGGIAMSAVALAVTERMRVGIGVMPIPYRNVAVAAMEVATLARLYPGRFLPGFGHGVQDWMGQAGARVPSFLTLAREYIPALRRLLAGEEVTVSGRYVNLDRVKLAFPPEEPPLLHIAGVGPKSLLVSGEIGDSTVLAGDARVEDLPRVRADVIAAREAAGRPGHHEMIVFVDAAADDADDVVRSARSWVEAGADRVIFAPEPSNPDPVAFVRFIATEVQGRVG